MRGDQILEYMVLYLLIKSSMDDIGDAESLGGSTSPIPKFVHDGLHDVDGWQHRPSIQYRYHVFCSLATHQRSSGHRKR